MQLVISDSSPLIHLARINRFDLLNSYYSSVLIPRAVYEEVVITNSFMDGSQEVSDAMKRGEIIVKEIADTRFSASLKDFIHSGEAEVITLALEIEDAIILLDDQDARPIAARFNLKYTGLIGILIKAKMDGKITSLRDEIEKLRTVGRFWVSDSIIDRALTLVGEK